VAAVVLTVGRTVRRRPLLAIRALVLSWLYFFLAGRAARPAFYWLWSQRGSTLWRGSLPWLACLAIALLVCALGGWLIARTHRAHAASVVTVVWVIGGSACLVWLLYLHFDQNIWRGPSLSDVAVNCFLQLVFLACGIFSAAPEVPLRRVRS
jgi:hypothetical protein